MHGLFYHVNVPLMRGHLVNAAADRIFWFSVPAQTQNILFPKWRRTNSGVVRKTMLYRGFGYKVVAKWTCLNLLRIALTILKKQVKNVNEQVSTCCLFDAAVDINRCR